MSIKQEIAVCIVQNEEVVVVVALFKPRKFFGTPGIRVIIISYDMKE